MQRLITHSGTFHADDAFAIAALQLFLAPEDTEVVRTRDEAVLATGDWVVDVGNVYDPERRRFDHHQQGAPVRENGIPYAAFGLVWKHVGEHLAGSKEAAAHVEQQLAQPIDADDNGVAIFTPSERGVVPFSVSDCIALFLPVWQSGGKKDIAFDEAVLFARSLLTHAIAHAQADVRLNDLIGRTYAAARDKRVLVFDMPVPAEALIAYPETHVVVSPHDPATGGNWSAETIRIDRNTFTVRAQFPAAWAGLREGELAAASGIADAVFAHKARHYFVAKSKEGALAASAQAQ